MNSYDWERFHGDYIKWEHPGQKVEGAVSAIGVGNYKGNEYPELTLETADGRQVLSASQANLKRQLAELRPEVGDHLVVEYLGEGEQRPGQSPVKLFKVEVTRRGVGKPAPDAADLA
jgi:hypothetical protein